MYESASLLFFPNWASTEKLLVLFGGAGMLAYLAFGSEVQAVILVNLDTKNRMVQSVGSLKITPTLIFNLILIGSINICTCDLTFGTSSIFPSGQDSGEWPIYAQRKSRFPCQVAEEWVQISHGYRFHRY